jgi:hypothetical protein
MAGGSAIRATALHISVTSFGSRSGGCSSSHRRRCLPRTSVHLSPSELIGSRLLLVTTEFDRWEVRDRRVADRLDALFLDMTGAPVVVPSV